MGFHGAPGQAGSARSHGTLHGTPGLARGQAHLPLGQGQVRPLVDAASGCLRSQAALGRDLRVDGWRGGFVLRGDSAAIRDQAFDGQDYPAWCPWPVMLPRVSSGAQVGDFPRVLVMFAPGLNQPALFLHGTLLAANRTVEQVGILLDELLLHGGPMLEDVGVVHVGLDLV